MRKAEYAGAPGRARNSKLEGVGALPTESADVAATIAVAAAVVPTLMFYMNSWPKKNTKMSRSFVGKTGDGESCVNVLGCNVGRELPL